MPSSNPWAGRPSVGPFDKWTDSFGTVLRVACETGDTDLVVSSVEPFTAGDSIVVGAPSETQTTVTIASIDENTITLSGAVGVAYEVNTPVVLAELFSTASPSATGTVFNVQDYLALGDGTTDDTAAIQAAIDAASLDGNVNDPTYPSETALGGTVYFPAGIYRVSQLVLPSNVTLQGAGYGHPRAAANAGAYISRLKSTALANASMIFVPVDSIGVGIYDLQLDGYAAGQTWGQTHHGIEFEDPYPDWANNLHSFSADVRRNTIQNFMGNGIDIGAAQLGSTFERNFISKCGGHGIRASASDCYFLFNDIAYNGLYGISVETPSSHFIGNDIYNNKRAVNIADGTVGYDSAGTCYFNNQVAGASWAEGFYIGLGVANVSISNSTMHTNSHHHRHGYRPDLSTDLVRAMAHGFSAGDTVYFTGGGTSINSLPMSPPAVTADFATDVFTSTAHGLVANDCLIFTSITGGTTGISTLTRYYVISSGLTANAFKLSATVGGASINLATADITACTVYRGFFVIASGLATNAFRISKTAGGSTVDWTGQGEIITNLLGEADVAHIRIDALTDTLSLTGCNFFDSGSNVAYDYYIDTGARIYVAGNTHSGEGNGSWARANILTTGVKTTLGGTSYGSANGRLNLGGGAQWFAGNNTPESAVAAVIGSLATDIVGGDSYVKKTGSGSTGWLKHATTITDVWTPAITFGGAFSGGAAGAVEGRYTRNGPIVHCEFTYTLTTKGASTGNMTLTGLPLTAVNSAATGGGPLTNYSGMASMAAGTVIRVIPNTTTAQLRIGGAAADAILTHANFADGSVFAGSFTYETSA